MVRNGARRAALSTAGVVLSCLAAAAPPVGAAQLPDARGYELVSPPTKSGIDVIPQTLKTHVATDGTGVTFSAIGGFGTLQGTSLDAEYLSRRTEVPGTRGWSTQGINPLGAAETFTMVAFAGAYPTFVNGFTPDLSSAIYRSWHPLTDAPNVAEVVNLYRIDNLGSTRGSAELLSDSVTPLPPYDPLRKLLFLQPSYVGASSDLSHVAFESGHALTSDAPSQPPGCVAFGSGCPTLLYENAGGAVRLVGRVPQAGETTCDDVAGPRCVAAASAQAGISASKVFGFFPQRMISANGRRIMFQVPANAPSGAIYLREDGVRTVQLAQDGEVWDASADGSRVFFVTAESLPGANTNGAPPDTDGARDLYMYDANAVGSPLTLISASRVADGNVPLVIGASADGRYVYFVCEGQLVEGEPPADVAGVYVWHDGALAYIGALQDVSNASQNSPRTPWASDTATTSRVSPDGRHLLFMTRSDAGFKGRGGFAGYEHADHREYYVYSADTGRLACASCNPSGRAATVDAVTAVKEGAATSAATTKLSHALSDDGRRAFFSTAEALVSEDTNGVSDAYEFDVPSETVHLISSGTEPTHSYFIDASANGDDVFFVTRQRLLGWDVDDNYDLYDARVSGGFPEPIVSAPCAGEGCLGQGTAAPDAGSTASPKSRGAGDVAKRLKRHRRCGRRAMLRRVRGKARCVRRRSHRHARRASVTAGVRHERSGR